MPCSYQNVHLKVQPTMDDHRSKENVMKEESISEIQELEWRCRLEAVSWTQQTVEISVSNCLQQLHKQRGQRRGKAKQEVTEFHVWMEEKRCRHPSTDKRQHYGIKLSKNWSPRWIIYLSELNHVKIGVNIHINTLDAKSFFAKLL